MHVYFKPNFLVAALGFIVFAYSIYILQRDISGLYQNSQSFFGQSSQLYPLALIAAACLAPICILSLAAIAFFNKVSWLAIPLAVFGWFVLGGYIVTAFIIAFLIWQIWARKNATT